MTGGTEILKIHKAGILTSLQDEGRVGFRQYGIPQSGFLDRHAAACARFLAESAHALCIENIGGTLEVEAFTGLGVGVSGTGCQVYVNGNAVNMYETLALREGYRLKIVGGLCYIHPGLRLSGKMAFGSASTYPPAQLGGIQGKLLASGQILCSSDAALADHRPSKKLPEHVIPRKEQETLVRLLKGQEVAPEKLEHSSWQVSVDSNRMGLRLEGESVQGTFSEMKPVPVFPGTIQLTHGGTPVILLNDGQTTGGYPRAGQVIKADKDRVARMITDGTIRFTFVSIDEARKIYNSQQSFFNHALR